VEPTPEAIDLLRRIVLADKLQALRMDYCRVTVTALTSISSWIRVDAFLGGGNQPLNERPDALPSGIEPDEYVAFQAIAAVIDMAAGSLPARLNMPNLLNPRTLHGRGGLDVFG
jgi:hypothetical protein